MSSDNSNLIWANLFDLIAKVIKYGDSDVRKALRSAASEIRFTSRIDSMNDIWGIVTKQLENRTNSNKAYKVKDELELLTDLLRSPLWQYLSDPPTRYYVYPYGAMLGDVIFNIGRKFDSWYCFELWGLKYGQNRNYYHLKFNKTLKAFWKLNIPYKYIKRMSGIRLKAYLRSVPYYSTRIYDLTFHKNIKGNNLSDCIHISPDRHVDLSISVYTSAKKRSVDHDVAYTLRHKDFLTILTGLIHDYIHYSRLVSAEAGQR